MIPNFGPIAYSVGMECMVGLHKFDNGEVWLVREHNDHFCTVRKATDADVEMFKQLRGGDDPEMWERRITEGRK